MCTRLSLIAVSLVSMSVFLGCDAAPFDYYPHHETAVACSDVHKGTDPGSFGGFANHFTSSTAGTNPATGPATTPATVPAAMSIGK